jgi:endonuclease/exonuclease/phosphatase (EEP) superfamily protein YafD
VTLLFFWLPYSIFYLTSFRQWFFFQEALAGFHHYIFVYCIFAAITHFRSIPFHSHPFRKVALTIILLLPLARSVQIYLPYYLYNQSSIKNNASTELSKISFVFANKYLRNDGTEWLTEIIKTKQPQVIAIAESDLRWVEKTTLINLYPYRATVFDQSVWGLELFSKFPFEREPKTDLGPDVPGYIHARILLGGQDALQKTTPLNIVIFHLPPPISAYRWEQARNMSRRVATEARHSHEPWLIAGDFNSAPAGRITRSFMKAARVRDVFWGFGFQSTWNQDIWFLQTMIDRAFVNKNIFVNQAEVLPVEGSDHRGIFLELTVNSDQAAP